MEIMPRDHPFIGLLPRMLCFNPDLRITAEEALNKRSEVVVAEIIEKVDTSQVKAIMRDEWVIKAEGSLIKKKKGAKKGGVSKASKTLGIFKYSKRM